MQKIKHFKLSVIMHTMSKATYDQNIFYTSDSELMLKFELIEKEFSYDSGEILLFNETDKSFVTRMIDKDDDGFVYHIENDIIQHHGKWTGQLQLVKNGEVYTSKPFNFTIENDLSSVSPPQLIDINNWSTLKQSAIDLIDDMKNVIGEYDKAAISFQQSENNRIDNETSRKQAESTRQNHETTRQIQESDRERNEDVRKANEVSRTETFNTNEAVRKENETVRLANESSRQQVEQGRVSAEIIRVENENQRKTDHANRSAELAGKANKEQEEWVTVPIYNGAEYGRSPLKVMKDEMGVVHFKGSLTNLVSGSAIFNLPKGYLPDINATIGYIRIPVSLNSGRDFSTVQINYIGNGYITNPLSTQVAFFDGVSYVAKRG